MNASEGRTSAKIAFKVATLNTWHGLSSGGKLFFKELESPSQRLERMHRQLEILRALNAQVIALQEVNPLPFRAYWYAERLGMKVFYAAANQGLKVLWGPPLNLNEGLALLVPSDARVEYLGKRELSGNKKPSVLHLPEQLSSFLSLQLEEARCALAVRLHMPDVYAKSKFAGARSVLLVTTHLHHGHWASDSNMSFLLGFLDSGYIDQKQYDTALMLFRKANSRRIAEVERLIAWCKRIKRMGEPIILLGDLNTEPESAPLQILNEYGFQDPWPQLNPHEKGCTWNPSRNAAAFLSRTYEHYRKKYGNGVANLFQKAELVPRRIDFILHRKWNADLFESEPEAAGAIGQMVKLENFGFPKSKNEHALSDHFGVMATYERTL